jgi:uncharacterized protein YjbJ (UPF0337 family)
VVKLPSAPRRSFSAPEIAAPPTWLNTTCPSRSAEGDEPDDGERVAPSSRNQDATESPALGERRANNDRGRNNVDEKWDQVKGKAKERVGEATDDEDLEAEGKLDQAKGKAKEGWEDTKEAGAKAKEAVRDATR